MSAINMFHKIDDAAFMKKLFFGQNGRSETLVPGEMQVTLYACVVLTAILMVGIAAGLESLLRPRR